MNDTDLLSRLGVALAIGLLVGLERGWNTREEPDTMRPAGLRTFALTGLLGGIAGAASLALFTREIWANPRAMGAACPSAPSLASHMASHVPLDRDGLVVELGGGTGAVTAALLKHGVPPGSW